MPDEIRCRASSRRQLDRLMTRWLSEARYLCVYLECTYTSTASDHPQSLVLHPNEHRDIPAPSFCDGELIVHGVTVMYTYIYIRTREICERCVKVILFEERFSIVLTFNSEYVYISNLINML